MKVFQELWRIFEKVGASLRSLERFEKVGHDGIQISLIWRKPRL